MFNFSFTCFGCFYCVDLKADIYLVYIKVKKTFWCKYGFISELV
ncbi:MAG: hypothetical protein ACI93P_001883, partial [bacterium]